MALPTFAILFHLRLDLEEQSHLGKNHRKRAVPAEYVAHGGKTRARQDNATNESLRPGVRISQRG